MASPSSLWRRRTSASTPANLGRRRFAATHVRTAESRSRHPRAFHLVALRRNDDPAVLSHVAKVLGLFRAAGFSEEQALLVNAVTDAYNSGFSLVSGQELSASEAGPRDPHVELLTPPLQLKLAAMTSDAAFERGLDIVIAGIEATLAPSAPESDR